MRRRTFLGRMGVGAVALRSDALHVVERAGRLVEGMDPQQVAMDEGYWAVIRRAYTVDANQINLNSGSVSPSPIPVQHAVERGFVITNASPSLWVDEMLGPQREVVRRRLAAAAGCDPEEMAVTRNTSEAMQIVQMGLDLNPGDEVLITTQDYPRMLTTWEQRARRHGIVVTRFPIPSPPANPMDLLRLFEERVGPRTRVVHMSHVTYTAGQILPVKEICAMARRRGILTVVDGAHGFAHFPFRLDDLGCDFYGTSLHKWLNAPVGTGFLYVRRERIPDVWPLQAAPASMDDDVRKFEQIGTFPVAIPNAVGEALTFLDGIGLERKAARLRYLRRRWMDALSGTPGLRFRTARDDAQAGALATVSLDGLGADALTAELQRRYAIHVRPRFVRDEWEGIRVTPNVFTTLEEVDTFVRAMKEIAASL